MGARDAMLQGLHKIRVCGDGQSVLDHAYKDPNGFSAMHCMLQVASHIHVARLLSHAASLLMLLVTHAAVESCFDLVRWSIVLLS